MTLPISTLASLLFLTFACLCAAYNPDPAGAWGGYPGCAAERCLVPISWESSCLTTGNSCLCLNTTFIAEAAACIGTLCPSDGPQVYATYQSNCLSDGGYTLPVSLAQWAELMNNNYIVSFSASSFPTFSPTLTVFYIASRVND
jgi:hypothetical protein